jgi:hypothetical protein
MAHSDTATSQAPTFAPGQMWSIKSDVPTTARVVIGRIEPFGNQTVVHVSIINVPIASGMPGAGGQTQITHMPFEQTTLANSVDQLLATNVAPVPGFEDGYAQWKSANGGIFTISVPKAIELIFDTINKGSTK